MVAFATGAVAAVACAVLSLRSRTINQPALAVVLLALGLGVALLSWRLSTYLLLVYLPYGGLAILASYPRTQLADIAKDLAFVIPAYIGFILNEPRKRWLFPGLPLIPIAALSAIVLVECFNPVLPNFLVALIGLKIWLFYLPLLVIGFWLVQGTDELQRLLAILLAAAAIPIFVGLVEAVLVDVLGKHQAVYDLYGAASAAATQNFAHFHYGSRDIWRIPSTFSFVAQYFSFTAAMTVVAYAWWRISGHARLGLVPVFVLVLASLTSGERGALIMLPLLIVLMVALDGRVRLIATLGAVVAVMLAAALVLLGSGTELIRTVFGIGLGELHDTVIVGFVQTLQLGLFGHGTGTATGASRFAFSGTQPLYFGGGFTLATYLLESWWLRTIYELGLPGFAAAIALFAVLVARGWRTVRSIRDTEIRAVAAAILAFLLWNLIYDLKGSLMNLDPINVYFWLLAGLMLRLGVDFARKGSQQVVMSSAPRAAA